MTTPTNYHRLFVLLTGLLALLPASACFSGLIAIPTTDLVAPRDVAVYLQFDGGLPGHRVDTYIANSQFGLTDRLEAGVDYDFSSAASPRTFFNAKYLLPLGGGKGLPLVAAGVTNVAQGTQASPYLTASRDCGLARVHAGAIMLDGTPQAFVGMDRACGRWTVMADHITGPGNATTAGVFAQVTEHIGVLAGAEFPNGGGETRFTAQLYLCGSYCRHPAEK